MSIPLISMQTTLNRAFYDFRHHEVHPQESVATLVITVAAMMMLAGLVLFFARLTSSPADPAVELPSPGQAMDGTRL